MTSLFIIDASAFLFRSYYAIQSMSAPNGESTNALYGFIRSIQKLRKDFSPTHLIAVFDGPNNAAARKSLYPAYKANRTKAPPDLGYQIDYARHYCSLEGIPLLNIPNVEADDVMGSIALWGQHHFETIYLCSGDKDLCQLVNEKIHILNTHKDNLILDPQGVRGQFGVDPNRIIDYLSIVGDSSDNIPGLSGFGPKSAEKLLQEYGSLSSILAHKQAFSEKKKETLEREEEQMHLNEKLLAIDTTVPFPQDTHFFQLTPLDPQPLMDFFTKMNFRSLLKEVPKEEKATSSSAHLVEDKPSLQACLKKLIDQKEICFSVKGAQDPQGHLPSPRQTKLLEISLSCHPDESWHIPFKPEFTNLLSALFSSQSFFYSHDIKYALHLLANEGIELPKISFDTILASYILNAHQKQHSLEALALEHFGLSTSGKSNITVHESVLLIVQLKQIFQERIQTRGLQTVYYSIELPLTHVLFHMERQGIYLDKNQLALFSITLNEQIKKVAERIYALSGEEFNLNSPKQLAEILFNKLNIPPPQKTKTGFSTNADVLETLQTKHPIAAELLEYRGLEKLRSTYVDSLPHQINPDTGRIHCTFSQITAATGRLASLDPNLQNIPVRTPMGRQVRAAFKPQREGWSFLSADYSQIELRLMAHLSADPHLITAFKEGRDIHADTAARIFGIPLSEVTKEQRYRAKAVNFGIIYGQQAFGLARELGIDPKEAKTFIDTYFNQYKRVKEFIEESIHKARLEQKATTLTGRERALPDIHSKNKILASAAERLAVNTPLQGTAADLIKLAMIRIEEHFKREKLKGFMVLQIHDELLFELPDVEIEQANPLIREAMEKVWDLSIPLTIDLSVGKNWELC